MTAIDATPPVPSSSWRALFVCAISFGILWFSLLGHRDLLHPDEGRYAEIPREMLESRDWITPRLDGLKYFEKPPLQYWATALAFELFGAGNGSARLWPSCLGFLAVFWTYFVGRRVFGARVGALSGVVLATSLLWVAMGHILTLDMGLSVFLWFSIGALVLAHSDGTDPVRCRRWMLFAWTALAAATLSKGPVAIVLAGGTLAIYTVWQRDFAVWRRLHLRTGVLLFTALAAPWFVAVALRNPGFMEFFFLHEHFARYATDVAGRTHAWWTFLAVVILGSTPWVGSAVAALVRPGFAWRSGGGGFDAERFLWVWCAFTVAFFSISQSKLIPYVLPVLPALAVLIGRRLAARPRLAWDAGAALAFGCGLLVIGFVPDLIGARDLPKYLFADYRGSLLSAAALLLGAGVVCVWIRGRTMRAALVLGGACLVAFQVLLVGFQCFSPVNSSRELADAIRADAADGAPVYCVRRYEQPLPFYLGRTVDLVQERGELDFGLKEEPRRQIADLTIFRRVWTDLDRGVAILPPETYRSLAADGLPMRVIREDGRRVAVARR